MRARTGWVLVVVAAATVACSADVRDFARRHWRAPLAPQGPAPDRFSPIEASLHPEACGACHPAQLADWRTSWHAAATGPGVAGQLVEMIEREPETALGCLVCHAPLAEQAPLMSDGGALRGNPAFDAALLTKGLVCAGCHVRGHERFGPPRRDGSLAPAGPRATLAHGGVTRTPAFLASEFCRGCHQFEAGALVLNGKPLENTYEEWRASAFARRGVHCQDCHMPDRRHLWRGIHDPEMVRSGIAITVNGGSERHRPGDTAHLTLTVESTRVGHAFPTYVTPRVVLRGELLDAGGTVVAGSVEEVVIAREVSLDLSREEFDTRLLPGRRATLEYRRALPAPGLRARLSVVVYPDAFYTRFFEARLAGRAGRGEAAMREALEASRRSAFTVFEREVPLT
jgi:Cytochrome c554 and c-prime